jgi:hypothetical protein
MAIDGIIASAIKFINVSFLRRQESSPGCPSEFIPHLMRDGHDNENN